MCLGALAALVDDPCAVHGLPLICCAWFITRFTTRVLLGPSLCSELRVELLLLMTRVLCMVCHSYAVRGLLLVCCVMLLGPSLCSELRVELLRERATSGAGARDSPRGLYVRAYYCGGTHGKALPWADTVPVAIMGAEERGGVLVELGDFVRLVGPFLPVDYDAECGC